MKKTFNKQKTFLITLALALTLLITTSLSSCYSPNPLYGRWADNQGNQITFNPDLTYNAKLYDSTGIQTMYDGNYNVIDNIISFSTAEGNMILTEWDIRGSVLYLTWTTQFDTSNITLYRVSK